MGPRISCLEWAACKWGWDQDYAMAEAIDESVWKQSEVSGNSYGILQVNVSHDGDSPSANSNWGGYPWVQESTAVNADAQMAYLRSCYDGDVTYLGNGYHAGELGGALAPGLAASGTTVARPATSAMLRGSSAIRHGGGYERLSFCGRLRTELILAVGVVLEVVLVFVLGLPERTASLILVTTWPGHMPEASVSAIVSSATWRCSSLVEESER